MTLGQKKKIVMLPSPDQNLKIGSVGQVFFFFFSFFLRTVRELSFPIFFFKFEMGKTRAECSQNAYTSHASAFLSHWIQILAILRPNLTFKKKKKKKLYTRPCFFAFYGRSGEGNITSSFFLALEEYRYSQPCGMPKPNSHKPHNRLKVKGLWKSLIFVF